MDAAALLARVRAAFPTQPLPEITLRQAQLTDQGMAREITDEEWTAEGDRDRGIPWHEIPDETLLECGAALSHLDNDAFVYYLAAFLTFALRKSDRRDFREDDIFGCTVFAVTELSNYNLSRLKRLTDEQIDVVTDFVRWVSESEKFQKSYADKALTKYWETPDARRRTLIYVP